MTIILLYAFPRHVSGLWRTLVRHKRTHVTSVKEFACKLFWKRSFPLGRSEQEIIVIFFIVYSVRNATTGSFLAALLEGITPAMSVKVMLIITRITATGTGSTALKLLIPVSV